jgi:hypothetical protein
MENIIEPLRLANLVAFVALAVLSFRQWRRRPDEGARLAFITFLTLASVVVVSRIIPDDSGDPVIEFLETLVVAILVLFPYFLYRLAGAFRKPSPRLDRIALAMTAAVALWSVLLPRIPEPDEPRPTYFAVFLVAFLVVFVLLSAVAAVRFWRAGKDQPPVAKRRLRSLSLASIALSVALVIAGAASGERPGAGVAIQLIALISVTGFYLAFFPPRWLRALWRRPSEENVRQAVIDLLGAVDKDSVIQGLLPSAVALVAGEGITVFDPKGNEMASYGMEQVDVSATDEPHLVTLEYPFGRLVVRTNPHTPFFGQDEIELLGTLGTLANLALERVDANELRVQLAEAQLRRQQALEINDNVVQGLAVAKYSMELGEHDRARAAVESTLEAARHIISELLHEDSGEGPLEPGSLIRDHAVPGFTAPP